VGPSAGRKANGAEPGDFLKGRDPNSPIQPAQCLVCRCHAQYNVKLTQGPWSTHFAMPGNPRILGIRTVVQRVLQKKDGLIWVKDTNLKDAYSSMEPKKTLFPIGSIDELCLSWPRHRP